MHSWPGFQAALFGVLIVLMTSSMDNCARAQSKVPVGLELVLAVDISSSVDDTEYALQMTGIANAFRSPEIIALIEQQRGIAITLFQWSSRIDTRFAIPWHFLKSEKSVLRFADKVQAAARDPVRGYTAIGRAIEFGVRQISENNYEGEQLKIDISGDGRNNTGPRPAEVWRGASAEGIVINGLPIIADTIKMPTYFRENVIFGPGAFIEIAENYKDFAQAFFRKLRRELTILTARNNRPLHDLGDLADLQSSIMK
jgi:hypothetical protein